MHVSGWAKRFLFKTEQLNTPVRYLSGGEQARILIAQLMLQPADVLILDEPTNDLDIPTLEVLEDSLSSFPGALVLVTHDRYLLETVSTDLLALDGRGGARSFRQPGPMASRPGPAAGRRAACPPQSACPAPNRLTTAERRELGQMEAKIEAAEEEVAALQRQMEDPAVASDAAKLHEVWNALPVAQEEVAALYARWEELEAKQVLMQFGDCHKAVAALSQAANDGGQGFRSVPAAPVHVHDDDRTGLGAGQHGLDDGRGGDVRVRVARHHFPGQRF